MARIEPTWNFTARSVIPRRRATALLGQARRQELEHLAFPLGQRLRRGRRGGPGGRGRPRKGAHEEGIQDQQAVGDGAQGHAHLLLFSLPGQVGGALY